MQTHIRNPKTNRMIKLGSKQAVRLAKEGIITLPEPIVEVKPIQEPVIIQDEKPAIIADESEAKSVNYGKMKKELKEIAQENKEQFVGISQEQADELLKKMLYEKLFVNKPSRREVSTRPTGTPNSRSECRGDKKKKKKKKKRVIVQSSSDDSDSESEDW